MKTSDPLNNPSLPVPSDGDGQDEAANMIRHKLDVLYAQEPDAVSETIESTHIPPAARSKHQKFMLDLSASGKPFHEIQVAWHDYYKALSDKEKHEVWQEFYAAQNQPIASPQLQAVTSPKPPIAQTVTGDFDPAPPNKAKMSGPQSVAQLKNQITKRVQNRTRLTRKQHLKSLGVGLSAGLLTIAVLLFGFFNERVIAPFITPSRNVSATPLILDENAPVGKESKLIIPKINVEVPVVYDVETIEEADVQKGLERGVVHYATTSNPGEKGNGAIFGHSSNNILNRGKYKFAFVLLSRLENGDTFYIEKGGVRYIYKIFNSKVVSPSEIEVLDAVPGKTSTMALITCDPPGTDINRLVVWGEQISPDPLENIASTAVQTSSEPDTLAGNPQSLWSRIWSSVF